MLSTIGYGPTPPPGPSQARDRWESWAALVSVARELVVSRPQATLVDLVEELQHRATTQHAPAGDGVTLSSLHSAKGLEWDTVFLVGLTDGMMPITYASTPEQVAEERRLLYVGITRARTRLVFSYARTRNAGDRRTRQPSPFLRSLGTGFAEEDHATPARTARSRAPAACRGCGRALTTPTERKLRHCAHCEVDIDLELFESLRKWRKQTAEDAAVPAFVVFTDATLDGGGDGAPHLRERPASHPRHRSGEGRALRIGSARRGATPRFTDSCARHAVIGLPASPAFPYPPQERRRDVRLLTGAATPGPCERRWLKMIETMKTRFVLVAVRCCHLRVRG